MYEASVNWGIKVEFFWSESTDGSGHLAETEIWKAINQAVDKDEGVCYHRYPVFTADRSRREPDILLFHRKWGLFVIECKGCNIDNIASINGSVWLMNDWHSSQETPYIQAEDQMFAVLSKFKSESGLRKGRHDLIQGHVFIALPFVTRQQWQSKGFDLSPASPTTMIFSDDLESTRLRARLQDVPAEEKQDHINDDQWTLAVGVLQGAPVLRREIRPEAKKPHTKAHMLRQVEQQMQTITVIASRRSSVRYRIMEVLNPPTTGGMTDERPADCNRLCHP